VGARVGEQDGESVSEEELGVSDHAHAIVAKAMEQEDGVAIGVVRMDDPGAEGDVVGCGDSGVGQVGVKSLGGVAHRDGVLIGKWAAGGVEGAIGEVDTANSAEDEIQEQP